MQFKEDLLLGEVWSVRRSSLLTLILAGLILIGCSTPAETTLQPVDDPPTTPALGENREGPPVPKTRPPLKLTFVGDIMLARTPGQAVEQGMDPFAGVASALEGADLTVGNLECVVATEGKPVPKSYNFRCHPRILPWVARYFKAVSVANNHSGDFGKDAFVEELDWLRGAGIHPFGGGLNEAEAYSPTIINVQGWRVAIFGVDGVELPSYAAGPQMPGVAWLVPPERIAAAIQAVRSQVDLVVVMPHWGYEYTFGPAKEQEDAAHLWLESGADMVIGAHPHVIQPLADYKGKLIAYSLGNFVFDDFKDVPAALNEPSRLSWIVHVTVGPDGKQSWTTQTARTDDQGLPQIVANDLVPCAVGAPNCRPQPK
jgi:hypothetical protein